MSIRTQLITAVLAGVALWGYGHWQYIKGRDQCNAAHNLAALEEYRASAEQLSRISGELESGLMALRDAKPKIIERITRVEVENPLPPGCVIPVDGLRELNDAIAKANATGKLGGSVPAD